MEQEDLWRHSLHAASGARVEGGARMNPAALVVFTSEADAQQAGSHEANECPSGSLESLCTGFTPASVPVFGGLRRKPVQQMALIFLGLKGICTGSTGSTGFMEK